MYSPLVLGVGGDTTAEVLWRVKDGGFPSGSDTEFVVIQAGANDILNTYLPGAVSEGNKKCISDQQARQADEAIIHAAANIDSLIANAQQKAPNAHVLIVGVLPLGSLKLPKSQSWPNEFTNKVESLNRLLKSKAFGSKGVAFVDCNAAFVAKSDGGEGGGTLMNMLDTIHPNGKGFKSLAKCIHHAVETVLVNTQDV